MIKIEDIEIRRRVLGLSQAELCRRASVHPNIYSKVKKGKANPTMKTMNALARVVFPNVPFSLSSVVFPIEEDKSFPSSDICIDDDNFLTIFFSYEDAIPKDGEVFVRIPWERVRSIYRVLKMAGKL